MNKFMIGVGLGDIIIGINMLCAVIETWYLLTIALTIMGAGSYLMLDSLLDLIHKERKK